MLDKIAALNVNPKVKVDVVTMVATAARKRLWPAGALDRTDVVDNQRVVAVEVEPNREALDL